MSDFLLKERQGKKLVLLAGLRLHKDGPDHFAGSGILHDSTANARIRELFFNGDTFAGLLTDNDELEISADFQITSLEFEESAFGVGVALALDRVTRPEPNVKYLNEDLEI